MRTAPTSVISCWVELSSVVRILLYVISLFVLCHTVFVLQVSVGDCEIWLQIKPNLDVLLSKCVTCLFVMNNNDELCYSWYITALICDSMMLTLRLSYCLRASVSVLVLVLRVAVLLTTLTRFALCFMQSYSPLTCKHLTYSNGSTGYAQLSNITYIAQHYSTHISMVLLFFAMVNVNKNKLTCKQISNRLFQ